MTRGPPPRSGRTRTTGARELRAWVSANEYADADEERRRLGYRSIGDWLRALIPVGHICEGCGARSIEARVVDGSDEWWCPSCR